jgi:dihydrodiol dehydrogenase / D-xylose 1-dehydrogenase (NADP)
VKDGILLAAGSRSDEKAKAFADRFRISYRYGSYRALADDRRVDAVYIATPASEHKAAIELCLRAGKAVLCEKPLTVNRQEAEDVIILARRSGIFLMEAMWTRFLPLVARLRELLARKVIGDIRHVMADAATNVPFDPESRVFNPELGGGALLQKGVYLLSLTSMILGSPIRMKSLSSFAKSGVDEGTGMLLEYPNGRMATLVFGRRAWPPSGYHLRHSWSNHHSRSDYLSFGSYGTTLWTTRTPSPPCCGESGWSQSTARTFDKRKPAYTNVTRKVSTAQ